MLLITTAIEDTWGTDEEILFLGEWCKLNNRKKIWEERISETLPDPWSDRDRRFAAYQFTENVYQNTIRSIASVLNDVHGVNYPVRYWKILCGPWLRLFINILYHKWECIEDVIRSKKPIKTFVIEGKSKQHVPVDMTEFETNLVSDHWNHYICALVIKEMGLPFEAITIDDAEPQKASIMVFNKPSAKRRLLVNIFRCGIQFINRPTSVFISQPYLSKQRVLFLCARLWTVPRVSTYPEWNQKNVYNNLLRGQIAVPDKPNTVFECFLNRIVLSHIPYNYLEGFSDLQRFVNDLKWQARPTAILTATDHFSDDIFKCYTANKILTGSKLKIICHGGGGKVKYSDYQTFELDLCDNYFTWGWSEYSHKCTKGYFIKENIKRRIKNRNQHSLLHITLSQFRHTKFVSSMPSYEQFIGGYLDDQIQFLNSLTVQVRNKTITKLHYDYQNAIDQRIIEKVPDATFASMGEDYLKLLKNAKLVVATYNCTTLVESIAYNIPTIVFWNPDHWELVSSAKPFFEQLRACGIFHDSPTSAALMVNKIWNDVDGWWQSAEVVAACNEFRSWFCRESQEPIKELVDFCNL